MQHSQHTSQPDAARDFLRRFWIVTALLIPLVLLSKTVLGIFDIHDFALRPLLQFGFATAIFYFSLIFFQHAKHEFVARSYGMMTLVSVAVGAGYLFSAASTFVTALDAEFYIEIATLIWVLLFGHFLEAKSSAAAGDALSEVAKLLPKQAHLVKGSKTIDVAIHTLQKGDIVLVKPGEKVPADGMIVTGSASFSESHISGESKPVKRKQADVAVAGAICIDGSVEVRLDKVGSHSTIGQIKQLIAQAQTTKPTAQKIADKAARILTFTALSVAIVATLVWAVILAQPLAFSFTIAITVLVIACPHALGLAIPTVSTIATQLAVKNGFFIKDFSKLEVAKNADYIVFDKTGTLTRGKFDVVCITELSRKPQTTNHKQIENSNTHNQKLNKFQKDILQIAASLEQHSSHVIGLSIVGYAKTKNVSLKTVTHFKNLAGKGIMGSVNGKTYWVGSQALAAEKKLFTRQLQKSYQTWSRRGATVVMVADAQRILGFIALADQIKPESKSAIDRIHARGLKVALLTGDTQAAADSVGGELGIDTVFAQVLPKDKYKHIKSLQDKGNTVIMVGDGVNDAPALTQADVGVAVGSGTDVAVEAGDVVLTRNNPEDIVRLLQLAKRVYQKMVENLFWALGYNILAIPAAAGLFIPFGFRLTPAVGALLMSLSSVIVVVNAVRLARVRLE